MNIQDNYIHIKESVPDKVLVIAVSKTRSIDEIKAAAEAGCRDFGENKAQEFIKKYEALPEMNWHFIGRLQRNKVKYIIGKVCLIHSVDSMQLVDEIEKRAAEKNIIQDILIQINASGEASKGGIKPSDLQELYDYTKNKSHIRVRGLMQVAPECDDPETVRKYFIILKSLFSLYKFDILSMGMSGDYKIALQEGSNCIRIGSAIFGKRIYKNSDIC